MFATKSALCFAILAVSTRLVVAAPPGCLLGALNTQPNPSDLNTLCGNDASKVQSQIMSLCGGNTDAALKAFASSCSAAGKTVPSVSASGTTSGSSSTTSNSASATGGSASASVTSAPYNAANSTMVYSSTFYDTACSCTKTSAISTMVTVMASAGYSSGLAGSGATGSPIAPTAASSSTSGPSAPISSGAASNLNVGPYAALLAGAAGVALVL